MLSDIQNRDYMYRLMIGQLFHDGHQQLALNLISSIGYSANPPAPCNKLFRLILKTTIFDEPEQQYKENTRMSSATFDDLPFELVEKIACHLDVKDVAKLMMMNKRLYAMDQSIVFGKHVAFVAMGMRMEIDLPQMENWIQKFVDPPCLCLDATLLPFIKRIDSCDTLAISSNSKWADVLLDQLKSVNQLRLDFSWNVEECCRNFFTNFCGSVKKSATLSIIFDSFKHRSELDQMKEQLGRFIENQLNGCEKISLDCYTDDCFGVYREAMMKTQIKMIFIRFWPENSHRVVEWIVNQGIPSKNSEDAIHMTSDSCDGVRGSYIGNQTHLADFLSRLQGQGLQRVDDAENDSFVSRANKILRENGHTHLLFDEHDWLSFPLPNRPNDELHLRVW